MNRPAIRSLIWAILLFSNGVWSNAARLIHQSASHASYVLDDSGTLWSWGDNGAGELGDGSNSSRAWPARVAPPGAAGWKDVAAGEWVLGLDEAGSVWGWGGRNSVEPILAPLRLGRGDAQWRGVAALAGNPMGLTLDAAGDVWVWRFAVAENRLPPLRDAIPEKLERPPDGARWTQVAGGRAHALLLSDNGRLFAWGRGPNSALGPGARDVPTEQLVEVPAPEPRQHWREIAAGPDLSLARLGNGEWYLWGALFTSGQVVGTPTPQPTRVIRPPGVQTWRQVSAGENHLLLLSNDGFAYGLGSNLHGQLAAPPNWGISMTNEPVRVFPVMPFAQRTVALSAGAAHGLALGEDGLLYLWGYGLEGQLGRMPGDEDWRPRPIRGAARPFSPSGPVLPRLELVPRETRMVAATLDGVPGTPAEFVLRRHDDLPVGLALSFFVRGDAATLPVGRVKLWLDDERKAQVFDVPPGRGDHRIRLTAPPGPAPDQAGNGTLRLGTRPWIEWTGTNQHSLFLDFPAAWSLPPTGFVDTGSARFTNHVAGWVVGVTNMLRVGFSDPDGWVTSLELRAPRAGAGPSGLLVRQEFQQGFPGIVQTLEVPWAPRAVGPVDFTLILRDNAGSVVTNHQQVQLQPYTGPRFVANWVNPPPALTGPTNLQIQVSDLAPTSPPTNRWVHLGGSIDYQLGDWAGDRLPVSVQPRAARPGETQSVSARLILSTEGRTFTLDLPTIPIVVGQPVIALETIAPEAFEGGTPGMVRATWIARNPPTGLKVPLRLQLRHGPGIPVKTLTNYPGLPTVLEFRPGTQTIELPVAPPDDAVDSGSPELWISLGEPSSRAATISPVAASATVRLVDDDRASITLKRWPARHPANRTLEFGAEWDSAGIGLPRVEILADHQLAGTTTGSFPPPLPLGRFQFRARLTGPLGQVAESAPVSVEIVPVLQPMAPAEESAGHVHWRVRAEPLYQAMILESSGDLASWNVVEPWTPSPAEPERRVHLPMAAGRFLRLRSASPE